MNDQEKIQLVKDYNLACTEFTKAVNFSSRGLGSKANKEEKVRAKLLSELLGRKPTWEEIQATEV